MYTGPRLEVVSEVAGDCIPVFVQRRGRDAVCRSQLVVRRLDRTQRESEMRSFPLAFTLQRVYLTVGINSDDTCVFRPQFIISWLHYDSVIINLSLLSVYGMCRIPKLRTLSHSSTLLRGDGIQ